MKKIQIRKSKSKSKRKSKIRKSKRHSKRKYKMDGVQGSQESERLSPAEQNDFKNLFERNANGIYEYKFFTVFEYIDDEDDDRLQKLTSVDVTIQRINTHAFGVRFYFHIKPNPNIGFIGYSGGYVSNITKYIS